ADVKKPVWAEADPAAIVIPERLGNRQQHARGGGIRPVPIRAVFDNLCVTRTISVVDEEQAVLGIVWMEGKPQQATLAAGADQSADVEEGLACKLAVSEDLDRPSLLDDEQPRIASGSGDEKRFIETFGHCFQRESGFL